MSTADRVLHVLADVVGPPARDDLNLPLYESHLLDSLGTVELIVAFAEEFGIEVAPSEIERSDWATPRRIIAFIERRVGG